MVETKQEWRDIIRRSEDTGCDGLELNFGCPHGMCERGMGSAVGQEPKVLTEITSWAKEFARTPVLIKLTPNVGDIVEPGLAAVAGGADGLSLINTIKSIVGVDLDRMVPLPRVGGGSTNGGYCGPAVKPIALHMLAALARDPGIRVPISGIGGVSNWRDAAEFIALGSTSVQVCTAVMHHGFKIVEDMIAGLSNFLDERGHDARPAPRLAVPAYKEWGELDLNYKIVAKIDADKCIGCQKCVAACQDGAHQCIFAGPDDRQRPPHAHHPGVAPAPRPLPLGKLAGDRVPWVDEPECVGCNLCALVCPVEGCITMVEEPTPAARRRGTTASPRAATRCPAGSSSSAAAPGQVGPEVLEVPVRELLPRHRDEAHAVFDALVSTSIGAASEPRSVLTQPGCAEATAMLLSRGTSASVTAQGATRFTSRVLRKRSTVVPVSFHSSATPALFTSTSSLWKWVSIHDARLAMSSALVTSSFTARASPPARVIRSTTAWPAATSRAATRTV
jgi:dihydropyrimidine dehydrogenase (NAD+) subunit PreA